VLNHADAKKLEVRLENMEGKAVLFISDDGVGFDMNKKNALDHFGLTGIQERARIIGGILEIQSKPGCGTKIKLTL
jgi:signal transduction histidine kinase